MYIVNDFKRLDLQYLYKTPEFTTNIVFYFHSGYI